MSSSRSRIIVSFLWKLMERFSVQFISFIVTIILARLLMPEEYGIVALISIFISLAEVIADGGFNTALIQKKDADNEDFSTVFVFSMVAALLLYVVLYFSAPIIAGFYEQPKLVELVRVLGLTIFLYTFNSIQRAYISKHMLFKKLFYSSLGAVLCSGVIGVMMAYGGYGVWALVCQLGSNQLFTIIIMWLMVEWRPSLFFSKDKFKSLFKFGWKIFFTNFIVTLFVKIRALVIGKLFSPATLAYYDKGNQIPSLISDNVCGSIQAVLFPAFSEVQDERMRVKSMMRRAINISCLFMYPLMIGLAVAAKPIVIVLLTEKWISVVPFMQILCLSNLFRPITIPNGQAITAMGYSGITLKLECIRKIVDIAILAVSCCFGAIGIAWGVVIFNFICLFINLYPNTKLLNYGIHEQIMDILPTLAVALLMGVSIFTINLIDIRPIFQIILMLILGIIVYITLCYLIKIESFFYIVSNIRKIKIK